MDSCMARTLLGIAYFRKLFDQCRQSCSHDLQGRVSECTAGDAEDRHSEADRPVISCQSVCQLLVATLRSGSADNVLYRSPVIRQMKSQCSEAGVRHC